MREKIKSWYKRNESDLKLFYFLLHFPALIFCGSFALIYKNPLLIPAAIFLYFNAVGGFGRSQEDRYAAHILNSIEEEELESFIKNKREEIEKAIDNQ